MSHLSDKEQMCPWSLTAGSTSFNVLYTVGAYNVLATDRKNILHKKPADRTEHLLRGLSKCWNDLDV